MIRFARLIGVAVAVSAACFGSARAETIYGIVGSPNIESGISLVRFDSASPTVSFTAIGNMSGVTSNEFLSGIHFRPSNGQLYAISKNFSTTAATLYTVNLTSAALTTVGTFDFPSAVTGSHVSMAFNPVSGGLRVVAWDDVLGTTTNLRIDPNTAAPILPADGTPAYRAGDPNAGNVPQLAAIAYSNNFAGATSTTLFTWDWSLDVFARVGSPGGTPDSPNTGILDSIFTPSPPGTFVTDDPAVGFDISGATGTAYVSHNAFGAPSPFSLFTINLGTGIETFVGNFPGGANVLDIAVLPTAVPEPSSLALLGVGSIGLAMRVWRRRKEVVASNNR